MFNGPTGSDPDVDFAPAQPLDAVHDVASVDDQVSFTDEPNATDAALEVKVTVGGGVTLAPPPPALPPSPPPQAASSRAPKIPRNDRNAVPLCITSPPSHGSGATMADPSPYGG